MSIVNMILQNNRNLVGSKYHKMKTEIEYKDLKIIINLWPDRTKMQKQKHSDRLADSVWVWVQTSSMIRWVEEIWMCDSGCWWQTEGNRVAGVLQNRRPQMCDMATGAWGSRGHQVGNVGQCGQSGHFGGKIASLWRLAAKAALLWSDRSTQEDKPKTSVRNTNPQEGEHDTSIVIRTPQEGEQETSSEDQTLL